MRPSTRRIDRPPRSRPAVASSWSWSRGRALVLVARWVILHRLPGRPITRSRVDADAHADPSRWSRRCRDRPRAASRSCEHVISLELPREGASSPARRVHLQPHAAGRRSNRHRIMVGVGVVVVRERSISRLLILRGDRPHGAVLQFGDHAGRQRRDRRGRAFDASRTLTRRPVAARDRVRPARSP